MQLPSSRFRLKYCDVISHLSRSNSTLHLGPSLCDASSNVRGVMAALHERVWSFFTCMILACTTVRAFNLDVDSSTASVFESPNGKQYFGYSVALHNSSGPSWYVQLRSFLFIHLSTLDSSVAMLVRLLLGYNNLVCACCVPFMKQPLQ